MTIIKMYIIVQRLNKIIPILKAIIGYFYVLFRSRSKFKYDLISDRGGSKLSKKCVRIIIKIV